MTPRNARSLAPSDVVTQKGDENFMKESIAKDWHLSVRGPDLFKIISFEAIKTSRKPKNGAKKVRKAIWIQLEQSWAPLLVKMLYSIVLKVAKWRQKS